MSPAQPACDRPPPKVAIEHLSLPVYLQDCVKTMPARSGERTSMLLVKAAAEVMAEKGAKALSVADVNRAAGTARGTYYIYFPDVKSVELAVLERYVTLREDYLPDPSDFEDAFEGIHQFVLAYARLYVANASLIRALIARIDSDQAFAESREQHNMPLVTRVLRLMRKHGLIASEKNKSAEMSVWALLGMMEYSLNVLYGAGNSPRRRKLAGSLEGIVDVISFLFYRGLFGETPAHAELREHPELMNLITGKG